MLNSEEFKEVLLYDANPHRRKLFILDELSCPGVCALSYSSVKKDHNAVAPRKVVYDEALNNVEEVHYDAVTYVCYDAVLSLYYLFSSSSIVWNYEENTTSSPKSR